MKVTTKHPYEDVNVDKDIKRFFILLSVLVLYLTKYFNYLNQVSTNVARINVPISSSSEMALVIAEIVEISFAHSLEEF